jgi:putative nucleotidyltransferase with HDIG domain
MEHAEALAIVREYVQSPTLINHMLAVESAMGYYAEIEHADISAWKLAGLLHDFDWEINPSLKDHTVKGAPILRERGVPEQVIRAIQSHSDESGIPRVSRMEKALYACDEVTGLITAVALVRPSRSLYDLSATSVKKKWKDRAFAAGANREQITASATDYGIDLWEHVENVIHAMRRIAPELNLAGSLDPVP